MPSSEEGKGSFVRVFMKGGVWICAVEKEKEEKGRKVFNLWSGEGNTDVLGVDGMASIGGIGSDRCGLFPPQAIYPQLP